MNTTVYFITNRERPIMGNGINAVNPNDPTQITFGRAFISDINLSDSNSGQILSIDEIQKGSFSSTILDDLKNSNKDLLFFIHGFDTSFRGALLTAAYNNLWYSADPNNPLNANIIVFSWPSIGEIAEFPFPWAAYYGDQTRAWTSGTPILYCIAVLDPLIREIRSSNSSLKSILLAHSLGCYAFESGVEDWFGQGQSSDPIFNISILAAPDTSYDVFNQPYPLGFSGLHSLSDHISILYSNDDEVLSLSQLLNNDAQRLGQNGPNKQTPYSEINCTEFHDYDFNPISSHQYYNESPTVRSIICHQIHNTVG